MEDPERMLDQFDNDASPLAKALLREGRDYCAPDHVRKHTLATLGVAASTGIVGSALAWTSARSFATKAVLALSTAGLLSAVPIGYTIISRHSHQVTTPAVAPVVPAAAPEAPPAPSVAPLPATNPERPQPTAVRSVARTSNSGLRDEIAALDAVRSSLTNNDPVGALSFLAAYFRSFPRGRLHPEAEVLRIDALAKAGHKESAQRHARDFLKRHPNSLLTARVRPYAEP